MPMSGHPSVVPEAPVPVAGARSVAAPRRGHSQRGGWGFLLPAVLVLFALTIFPFIFTVVLSLSNVDLTAGLQVQPGTLANWQQLIGDAQFWGSLGTTCLFVALAVVSEYILGFGLALLLWRDLRGGAFFRVIFLIPMMLAPVAIAFMGRMFYDESYGPLDATLRQFGLPGVHWLSTSPLALISIILVDIWEWTPFMILLLLAGLQALPNECLEAAQLDGASGWTIIRYIIVPMLAPISVMAVLLRMIEAFKIFGPILILTGGGPGTSTESSSLYAYFTGLNNFNLSYGSSLAVGLLIVVTIVAIIYLAISRRLVQKVLGT
jgi:multiple sugar transport system permease protein